MPIPIDDYDLFTKSLDLLSDFNIDKSNGIMAFLAIKYDDGHTVPSLTSPDWVTSSEIEDLFDEIYRKSDPRLGRDDGKVFKILNRKKDQIPTTSNRWRNILATQKGIVCYAPIQKMKDDDFLLQSYENCPYRLNRKCAHNPQGQHCINVWVKLLQKRPVGGPKRCKFKKTKWSLDLEGLLFSDIRGTIRKIPLYPLVVAIYFGSSIARGRSSITLEKFKQEFHLSNAEFNTLFEVDPSNSYNVPILTKINVRERIAVQTEVQTIKERSEDYVEPPVRVSTVVSRLIRNTAKSYRLKSDYNYACQICGKQIQKPDGSLYAEIHHIRPLGDPHHGLDIRGNMLVLCPNHHAEFDYGTIAIDPSKITSIHINKLDPCHGKRILLIAAHRLFRENLEYHLHNIFNK